MTFVQPIPEPAPAPRSAAAAKRDAFETVAAGDFRAVLTSVAEAGDLRSEAERRRSPATSESSVGGVESEPSTADSPVVMPTPEPETTSGPGAPPVTIDPGSATTTTTAAADTGPPVPTATEPNGSGALTPVADGAPPVAASTGGSGAVPILPATGGAGVTMPDAAPSATPLSAEPAGVGASLGTDHQVVATTAVAVGATSGAAVSTTPAGVTATPLPTAAAADSSGTDEPVSSLNGPRSAAIIDGAENAVRSGTEPLVSAVQSGPASAETVTGNGKGAAGTAVTGPVVATAPVAGSGNGTADPASGSLTATKISTAGGGQELAGTTAASPAAAGAGSGTSGTTSGNLTAAAPATTAGESDSPLNPRGLNLPDAAAVRTTMASGEVTTASRGAATDLAVGRETPSPATRMAPTVPESAAAPPSAAGKVALPPNLMQDLSSPAPGSTATISAGVANSAGGSTAVAAGSEQPIVDPGVVVKAGPPVSRGAATPTTSNPASQAAVVATGGQATGSADAGAFSSSTGDAAGGNSNSETASPLPEGADVARPTTPATLTTPTERLRPGEMVEQVRNMVMRQAAGGRTEVRIDLDPPHLGQVRLRVSQVGESVRLQLTVENAAAARALQREMPGLANALTRLGTVLETATVRMAEMPHGARPDGESGHRSQQNSPGEQSEPGDHGGTSQTGSGSGSRRGQAQERMFTELLNDSSPASSTRRAAANDAGAAAPVAYDGIRGGEVDTIA